MTSMTTITTKTEGYLVCFWRLESLQFNNLLANGFKHPQTIFFGGQRQHLKLIKEERNILWSETQAHPLSNTMHQQHRQLSLLKVAATNLYYTQPLRIAPTSLHFPIDHCHHHKRTTKQPFFVTKKDGARNDLQKAMLVHYNKRIMGNS